MAKTRYEWTVLDFAIWYAGAVPVPIYETSSAEQVETLLMLHCGQLFQQWRM